MGTDQAQNGCPKEAEGNAVQTGWFWAIMWPVELVRRGNAGSGGSTHGELSDCFTGTSTLKAGEGSKSQCHHPSRPEKPAPSRDWCVGSNAWQVVIWGTENVRRCTNRDFDPSCSCPGCSRSNSHHQTSRVVLIARNWSVSRSVEMAGRKSSSAGNGFVGVWKGVRHCVDAVSG